MACLKGDFFRKVAVSASGALVGIIIQNALGLRKKAEPLAPYHSSVPCPEVQDYLDQGRLFSQQRQFLRAVEVFTAAIRAQPTLATGYVNRGWAYNQIGQWDRAIQDCTQAIRLTPTSAVAYVNRGWAYGKQGHFARAVGDCAEAIRLDPNLQTAYEVLSWARAQRQISFRDSAAARQVTPRTVRPSP